MSQHELRPQVTNARAHHTNRTKSAPSCLSHARAALAARASVVTAAPRGRGLGYTLVLAVTLMALPLLVGPMLPPVYAEVPADMENVAQADVLLRSTAFSAPAVEAAVAAEEIHAVSALGEPVDPSALVLPQAWPDAAFLGPSSLLTQGLTNQQWAHIGTQAQAVLERNHLDGFIYSPRIAAIFAQHGTDGSFIAQRLGSNYLFGYNFMLAQHEFAPAATFNFVSAYLSLVLHVVPNIDVKFLNFRHVASEPVYLWGETDPSYGSSYGSSYGMSSAVPAATSAYAVTAVRGGAGAVAAQAGNGDNGGTPQPAAASEVGAAAGAAPSYRPDGRLGPNLGQAWPEPWFGNAGGKIDWSAVRNSPQGRELASARILEPDTKIVFNDGVQLPLYPAYASDSDTTLRGAFATSNAKVNSYWAELVEPMRIQQALEFLGLTSPGLEITNANKRTFWQDRSLQYSLLREVSFLNRLAQCSLNGASLQQQGAQPDRYSAAELGEIMTWSSTGNLVDHALVAAQTQHDKTKLPPPGADAAPSADLVVPPQSFVAALPLLAGAQWPDSISNSDMSLSLVQRWRQNICNQVLDVAVVAVFNEEGQIVRLSNGRGDNDLSSYQHYYVLYGKSNVINSGTSNVKQQVYRYAGLVSDEQGHTVSFVLAVPLSDQFSLHDGAHLLNEILEAAALLPQSAELGANLQQAAAVHCEQDGGAKQALYGAVFGARSVFDVAAAGEQSLLKMPLSNFGRSANAAWAQNGADRRNTNVSFASLAHAAQHAVAQRAAWSEERPEAPRNGAVAAELVGSEPEVRAHMLTGPRTLQARSGDTWARRTEDEPLSDWALVPPLDGRTGAASKNSRAQHDLTMVQTQTSNNEFASYRQGMLNDINPARYATTQSSTDLRAMLEDDNEGLAGKEVLHDKEGHTAGSVRRMVFADSVMDKAQARLERAAAGDSAESIERDAQEQRQSFFDVIDEISSQETPVSALERKSMVRASTEVAQSASIMNDIAEQRSARQARAQYEEGAAGADSADNTDQSALQDNQYSKCPDDAILLEMSEREIKERGLEDCLRARRNAATQARYPAVSLVDEGAAAGRSGRESG